MQPFDFLKIDSPIQIMDVGASAIAETPVYKTLIERNWGQLNAFEGDERQIEKIYATYGPHTIIYRQFLFDGTDQTIYLASAPSGMTSLLKPKLAALQFFNGFEQFGQIFSTESVQTKRLDDIEKLPLIDFVKMDIQGAELTVLKNGTEKLKDCLVIQLEVSWICLYENQPTFGEVDVWMRSQGFEPHKLIDLKRWSIAPTIFNNNFRVPGNQLLESDIVYIRDPLNLDVLSDKQISKLAVIAHFSLKSFDLCVHLLRTLEQRGSLEKGVHRQYLNRVHEL